MICPIGIECDRFCENYYQCLNLTHAWDIPYYKDGITLTVKRYGWRVQWSERDTCFGAPMNQCSLPSGQYLPVDHEQEQENKARLVEAWKEAGWAAAVPISDRPDPDAEDFDPIPF